MRSCHECGQDIQENSGVVRAVKTGVYASGGAYFRNVNLCRSCDGNQTRLERSRYLNKNRLILGGVVVLLGVSGYLLFLR